VSKLVDIICIILVLYIWIDIFVIIIQNFIKYRNEKKKVELPFATEPWCEEFAHMFDALPVISDCSNMFK